jgi:nicotinate-nucleotide pyrophosphorylase (carboxylating)
LRRRATGGSLPARAVDALVRLALREDVGAGDLTSRVCLPPGLRARGRIRTRRRTVVCGLDLAARAFRRFDRRVKVSLRCRDGQEAPAGATLAVVAGPAASVLAGERVALNFLQHLSGIATLARRSVRALRGTGVRLFDTRKTHPGLRDLEKYAVRTGGAFNHRRALSDAVLIKDNHVALAGGVRPALERARRLLPRALLTIEVDTLPQLRAAVAAGAGLILLDNFPASRLRRAVRLVGGRVPLEASGGVRLPDLPRLARAGVRRISMGALTHSVDWADIGFDIDPVPRRARHRGGR